ncbi:hypothetical protein KBA27_01640 [bacterium]|nr:hypothetical protein [bacterium]
MRIPKVSITRISSLKGQGFDGQSANCNDKNSFMSSQNFSNVKLSTCTQDVFCKSKKA